MHDNTYVIENLEKQIHDFADLGLLSEGVPDLITEWRTRLDKEPLRFINKDNSLNLDNLKNFRKIQILVEDIPSHNTQKYCLKNIISGGRRGQRKMLREMLEVLISHGYEGVLKKYPCDNVGNPNVFKYKGFEYTHRWFKHAYLIGLLNKILGSKLTGEFVCLDIGSSYGVFSSIMKREYPMSHHILLDFPEQLLLAYYFLRESFPDARIATISEISKQRDITKDFIGKYDFILLPCESYPHIESKSITLVTNFASLGEMRRTWFEYYLKGDPFVTAEYFFTANHIQSANTYDTDVSILDYPVWESEKRLHFGTSPGFSGYFRYLSRAKFFYSTTTYSPFFEYIGKI